jgi:two-component system, sensor histidine kinase and response regulator
MEILLEKITALQERLRSIELGNYLQAIKHFFLRFIFQIKNIGVIETMDEYEKRKLCVFNLLNFLQLLVGILIPFFGLLHEDNLPASAWILACLPCTISIAVLILNYLKKLEAAHLCYFILYPFFTGFVYLKGMNAGVELHFILYGVLAVFFLQDMGYMLFTIALSMVNYFLLSIVLKDFSYEVKNENRVLYFVNQLLSLGFIFYGLFLIKKENNSYQFRLLRKQRALYKKNIEISNQKAIIAEKAELLEAQANELAELNSLKTKLFSVIAHDLRSPMYAMRNLFRNIHQKNVPAKDVKMMIPDVLMDLNYTIGLMENLLQWSKTQMQSAAAQPEEVDVAKMIHDVMQLMRLQAEAKQIYIETKNESSVYAFADKDMINLVLRNLISNAIKFTPQQGTIEIGVNEAPSFIEVYVQDSGVGISKEAMEKINETSFYTTKGTSSESGTGLGLMLCKEFLHKNGGKMHIESVPGKGSIFSFTLPRS